MATIDFLNSWDKTKSVDWAQAELTNWYLQGNKRGKLPLAAYPCPGTSVFSAGTGTSWRGLYEYNGVLYGVLDSTFYSIGSDGTKTTLGTLSTSSGRVRFANITDQILLVDGTAGYLFIVSTSSFSAISDVDFPFTTTSITAQDEYFIAAVPGTPRVVYSDISDGTSWNALNLLQKSGISQNVIAVKSLYPYIWFIGTTSLEPYFNSGAPFERDNTGVLRIGMPTNAVDTVAVSTTSMFFVSKNASGGIQIIQAQPGNFASVSTEISYQLKQVTDLTGSFAYTYMQEDNEYYTVTFPASNLTFDYNITTKSWNKRESYVGGQYTRHIGNCYAFCYNKQIIGDYQSGNLYYMDSDAQTENGTAIRRTLVTYPFFKDTKYITIDRLIMESESGVGNNSTIDLYLSTDGGHTFNQRSPSRTIGTTYGARSLLYDRIGSARQWVFKVQTTMTDKCILLGATGDYRVETY